MKLNANYNSIVTFLEKLYRKINNILTTETFFFAATLVNFLQFKRINMLNLFCLILTRSTFNENIRRSPLLLFRLFTVFM